MLIASVSLAIWKVCKAITAIGQRYISLPTTTQDVENYEFNHCTAFPNAWVQSMAHILTLNNRKNTVQIPLIVKEDSP
jgi:hypothetical protein